MSKKKSSSRRTNQKARKREREECLSPEIRESFKAINKWIDQLDHNNAKEKHACAKVQANRRKLIKLSESQNHRCCYCGCDTWHPDIIDYKTNRSKRTRATLEHLLTASQGGTFAWDNLVMACSECNTARGDMPIKDFLKSIQAAEQKPKKQKKHIVVKSKEKRLKEERSHRNRLRLFIVAAWLFPVDYQYIMENLTKRDEKTVFKGGRKPVTTRIMLMKNIRRRVQENRMAA